MIIVNEAERRFAGKHQRVTGQHFVFGQSSLNLVQLLMETSRIREEIIKLWRWSSN